MKAWSEWQNKIDIRLKNGVNKAKNHQSINMREVREMCSIKNRLGGSQPNRAHET